MTMLIRGRWFRLDRHDRYLVRDAAMQIHSLREEYRSAAAEARNRIAADSTLYGNDARVTATREAIDALRQQYGARLDAIVARIDAEIAALEASATRALPSPAAGVEALLNRQAWWSRIKTMLDSGMRVPGIIRAATDPECLFTLRDELSTAIAAGMAGFDQNTDAAITNRLAQLAGAAAVEAQDALTDARQAQQVLRPEITTAQNEIGGTDFRVSSHADFTDELAKYGLRSRSGR